MNVAAFIRQRLSNLSLLKKLKKDYLIEHQSLAKEVYDSVQCHSQGMFLWAYSVFDQIWDLRSPESISGSLRRAPEGRDNILYHVFQRLEVQEQVND